MRNVFTKSGPAVRCLPVVAVDLSSKQKHPAINAIAAVWRVFRARPAKLPWNRMMSAANTPFIWLARLQNRLFGRPQSRPAPNAPFLTHWGALPIRPPFLKGSEFHPPPRLTQARELRASKRILSDVAALRTDRQGPPGGPQGEPL